MEEQKVNTLPLVRDPQPFLARYECEVIAKFEEKAFEMHESRFFELAFRVLVLQAKELKNERIANVLIGVRPRFCAELSLGGLRALIEL